MLSNKYYDNHEIVYVYDYIPEITGLRDVLSDNVSRFLEGDFSFLNTISDHTIKLLGDNFTICKMPFSESKMHDYAIDSLISNILKKCKDRNIVHDSSIIESIYDIPDIDTYKYNDAINALVESLRVPNVDKVKDKDILLIATNIDYSYKYASVKKMLINYGARVVKLLALTKTVSVNRLKKNILLSFWDSEIDNKKEEYANLLSDKLSNKVCQDYRIGVICEEKDECLNRLKEHPYIKPYTITTKSKIKNRKDILNIVNTVCKYFHARTTLVITSDKEIATSLSFQGMHVVLLNNKYRGHNKKLHHFEDFYSVMAYIEELLKPIDEFRNAFINTMPKRHEINYTCITLPYLSFNHDVEEIDCKQYAIRHLRQYKRPNILDALLLYNEIAFKFTKSSKSTTEVGNTLVDYFGKEYIDIYMLEDEHGLYFGAPVTLYIPIYKDRPYLVQIEGKIDIVCSNEADRQVFILILGYRPIEDPEKEISYNRILNNIKIYTSTPNRESIQRTQTRTIDLLNDIYKD